jgi:integrase
MKRIRIYRRGGVYWMDFFAQGKRTRQSTKCANRKDAQRFADAIATASSVPTFAQAVEVLRMVYGEQRQGIKLEDAWATYLKVATATGKADVAPRTLECRRQIVARFLDWLKKNRPKVEVVEQIDGPVAADYAAALAAKGLKTKTRSNTIIDLGTVWRTLEKASSDVRNPWGALCPRITDARRGEAFSREQERSVLDAAKKIGKCWYEVCQIMRLTGLRYGDVARLTWAEVGADAIRLKPHKTAKHGISVAIPLIPELRAVIDGISRETGDYLFPVHAELYGKRGKSYQAALNFREVLNAAGVTGEGFTIHSWRHTAATRLAEAGADIETRKRILGHTEDATARRYDHDEHLAETAAALESAAR